jgi:cobalt-zinc-cadmium resistance protein CzcA
VLETVRTNLLHGALLVILVLFAFLRDVRAGLVVALTIPLSMLFATNLMLATGVTGSLISLGAIDFGLLVDAAVIQVENVSRRLAEKPAFDRLTVARDAITEVRGPTLFGELIIAIVYLPVLTLAGTEGRLFRPMALTVLFALAGSMLLSLTLVPALASTVLAPHAASQTRAEGSWLARGYRASLRRALALPRATLLSALGLVLAAGALAPRIGSEFLPRLREGTIAINTVRLAGVSIDESVRYGDRIERHLLASFPDEIAHVWTRTGSAEITTDPMGSEVSDVFVTLTPRERWRRAGTQDELARAMSASLEGLPGMSSAMSQPIEMRMNEIDTGIRADLGVIVFGDDHEVLREQARRVEAVVRAVPGAVDVTTEQLTGQPTLEIEIDRAAIARHGISAADVLATVEAIGGHVVGTMQDGDRRVPIALRFDEASRASPESVGRLLVRGANGDRVPLDRLASIAVHERPAAIQRTWGRRRVVVSANVDGRDLGSFVADTMRAVSERAPMPEGYYVRYGGQFEHLERARLRLMIVVPLALLLVFGLLYATYGTARDAARVFTGVPFAAVGGVLALWARDLPFSVPAAVGFVALSGVSVPWCSCRPSDGRSRRAPRSRRRSRARPRSASARCS